MSENQKQSPKKESKKPQNKGEGAPAKEGSPNKGQRRPRKPQPWKKPIIEEFDKDPEAYEIPKEPKEVARPDYDKLQENFKKIEKKIKDIGDKMKELKDKRHEWRKEQALKRKMDREENQKQYENNAIYFSSMKETQKKIKVLLEEKKPFDVKLQDANKRLDEAKKRVPSNTSSMKLSALTRRIEELEWTQANEQLTGTEEKKLIKEKAQLKSAIPTLNEIDKIEKEIRKIRDERRPVMKKLSPLFEEKDKLRVIIDKIIESRPKKEERKEEKKEDKKEEVKGEDDDEFEEGGEGKKKRKKYVRPEVYEDPFSEKVDDLFDERSALYNKKEDLYAKFKENKVKFRKYMEEVDKREFIKFLKERHNKRKERLLKQQSDMKERLTTMYQKQIERASVLKNQPQIDACKDLIAHLETLHPGYTANMKITLQQDAEIGVDEFKSGLSGDLQNLKIMSKKAPYQGQMNNIKKKKRKGKKKRGRRNQVIVADKPAEEEVDESIPVDERPVAIEKGYLQNFADLELSPPALVKDLAASIAEVKALEDKLTAESQAVVDGDVKVIQEKLDALEGMDFDKMKELDHIRYEENVKRREENKKRRQEQRDRRAKQKEEKEAEGDQDAEDDAAPEPAVDKPSSKPSKVDIGENAFPELGQ